MSFPISIPFRGDAPHILISPALDAPTDWLVHERRRGGGWSKVVAPRTPAEVMAIAVKATHTEADVSLLPRPVVDFSGLEILLETWPLKTRDTCHFRVICPYGRDETDTRWAHLMAFSGGDRFSVTRFGSQALAIDEPLLRPVDPRVRNSFTSIFGSDADQIKRPQPEVLYVRFGVTALQVDTAEAARVAAHDREQAIHRQFTDRLAAERAEYLDR